MDVKLTEEEQKQYDKLIHYILDGENSFHQINQYLIYTYALEYIDIPKYIPLKQIFHIA
jgi:hypothetical protein